MDTTNQPISKQLPNNASCSLHPCSSYSKQFDLLPSQLISFHGCKDTESMKLE